MRKKSMSLAEAIILFVIGAFMGTIFTFGVQYWNAEVSRDSCEVVETKFVSYKEYSGRYGGIRQIAVDCLNGERFFIDGECASDEVCNLLYELKTNENITLLIHPAGDTIVEFSTDDNTILIFVDAMEKLRKEATGFLFLGIFMYSFALAGLYNIIIYGVKKYKNR